MELHDVEIIGLHPGKALLDSFDDIFPGKDMSVSLPGRGLCRPDETAAFAGQVEFGAPMRDVTADPLFAQPIVDRGVDIVDPGIERGVQNGFRLRFRDIAAARHAAQFHCPVAQHGDRQSGPSEFAFCYRHVHPPCPIRVGS